MINVAALCCADAKLLCCNACKRAAVFRHSRAPKSTIYSASDILLRHSFTYASFLLMGCLAIATSDVLKLATCESKQVVYFDAVFDVLVVCVIVLCCFEINLRDYTGPICSGECLVMVLVIGLHMPASATKLHTQAPLRSPF